jgi:hypothetical protein
VLAYASLADLLEGTSAFTWADLPDPQRIAVDRVLLREQAAVTDRRALAAAFLSVIERLSDHGPFLPAIDDLQWLDPSSVHVIAFAARRLSGPVGFLGTVRTEPDSDGATSWLQLPRPDAIHRIAVHPLSSRALHTVVRDELGHPVPAKADAPSPRRHRRRVGTSSPAPRARLDNDQTQPPSCVTPSTSSRSMDPAVGQPRPRRTGRRRCPATGTDTGRAHARRATSGRTLGVGDDEPRCGGQAVHQPQRR